jgi:hypothetical protein
MQLYEKDLEALEIVAIDATGFRRKVRIADLDKFVEFMESKGAKFPDYRKET